MDCNKKKEREKRKMRKRIFSFVLALLVMLSIMPVSAMAAESTGWDGTSKTEPATDGDGVYLIGTAEELVCHKNPDICHKNNFRQTDIRY